MQEKPVKTPQQKRATLDSISAVKRADIIRKKDSILNRNANAQGLTREQVRVKQVSDAKKPDAQLSGLQNTRSASQEKKDISKSGDAGAKARAVDCRK